MQYLVSIILVIVSYIFGSYFAIQGLKNEIDKPLFYSNEKILFTLTFLFGWLPFFASLYIAYIDSGILFATAVFIVRFVILPTTFNGLMKKIDEKI